MNRQIIMRSLDQMYKSSDAQIRGAWSPGRLNFFTVALNIFGEFLTFISRV